MYFKIKIEFLKVDFDFEVVLPVMSVTTIVLFIMYILFFYLTVYVHLTGDDDMSQVWGAPPAVAVTV